MHSSLFRTSLTTCLLLLCIACCDREQRTGEQRIVSLSPAMTEMLFSMGAGDRIVGVTTFCDFPPQAKKITKVGDFSHPSIERIIALKPDLVIVNLPEQMRIKKDLDRLKITTFVSSPHSLSEIYTELSALGTTLGLYEVADSLISYMKQNIEPVHKLRRKKVYVEISPRPIVTIGVATFLNDLIREAGGENIFADLDKDYPTVSQEAVIARDPEIIIVLHPQDITGRIGWQRIRAIKEGRVHAGLNPDNLMRPGPRLVEGYRALKEIIDD
ncbi:MAG: cobalamin-binding protein [candidate division WOR-3 bacterium]|nr:MAG: cobalamin-binding protein [candidate division WOR-3 bacterium]